MAQEQEVVTPRIKSGVCSKDFREIIKEDKKYRDLIESLHNASDNNETSISILPEIDRHIEKIEEELAECSIPKFDGDLIEVAKEFQIREGKKDGISVVPFSFFENPEFNINFGGEVNKFVRSYLEEHKIEYGCEKDTYDEIDGKRVSFTKYCFARELENGPSSVTIFCSDNSNEIYVFSDCFLNYPISRSDVSKYGGECIIISENNKNWFKKSELRKKFERALRKNEIVNSNIIFDKRFPGQETEKILNFSLLHSLLTANEVLCFDMISNFRLLINESCLVKIPLFRSSNGKVFSSSLLYEKNLLPLNLGSTRDEIDSILIKSSEFYYDLCNKSEIEIDGEKYTIEFDEVPLYQLALYCYSHIMEETYRRDKRIFPFHEFFSSELIKNVNVNDTLEKNSKLFTLLVCHAVDIGISEILEFAEKHKIGFHSKQESDINELVYNFWAILANFSDVKPSDVNRDFLRGKLDVLNFFISKSGKEIFKKMSENSKKDATYFSKKFIEWRSLFIKLYLGGEDNPNFSGSFNEENEGEVNIGTVLSEATTEYVKLKRYRDRINEVVDEIFGVLTKEYKDTLNKLESDYDYRI